VSFAPSSKARLTTRDLGRFASNTLFDRLATAVCGAGCLPRKELYEAWEVGRRVRRWFRGGRVVDLAGGHGLLAWVMLLLDDSSPDAIVVDAAVPASAARIERVIAAAWPRLEGRTRFITSDLDAVPLTSDDVVVSSHACGALTDRILARAADHRARVAVLPCCHDLAASESGDLDGWIDGALAVDIMRAQRLGQRGYRIRTQTIPSAITPRNRLLLGSPVDAGGDDVRFRLHGRAPAR
jgi:hypothetical protein